MHWHFLGVDAAHTGSWLLRTFWNDKGDSLLPDPDLARNGAFTILTFAFGWLLSLNSSTGKLKARIVDELILCQSELFARAYPTVWKQDGQREAWMLHPFVARLRFLYSSLNEQKSLSRKQLDRIEWYMMRVDEFIATWSATSRRFDPYHEGYKLTYTGLRLAVQDLGLKRMSRLQGLACPKDGLFGGPTPPPAPTSPQTPKPGPGLVPAE
ncbi:MAG: hypothetical protein GC155_10785 [Alphaproteobacteria bacterium]|nr:hypothetical protein [Alphaproteobacteria bacterium]